MATISGLSAPNPYAPPATKPKPAALANSSATVVSLPERVALDHAAFTPDWMQANHAAPTQGSSVGVYSAKGELQKLPEPSSTVNEANQTEETVKDSVDFSSDFAVRYAVSPGSGRPGK